MFPLSAVEAAAQTLLTVGQVAVALQVSTATVYKLCDRGELAHTRVMNFIRVRAIDLEAFGGNL